MAQARKSSASRPTEMAVLEKGSQIARPSSVGSIKQNIKKKPSEGLLVLSPEPGLVKFENIAGPPHGARSESPSSGRVGSAGRVERSLQLARKKEDENVSPRRNSAGPDIGNSIAQSLEGLHVKSQQPLQPNLRASNVEKKQDSESSETESSDSDDDDDDEGQATSTSGAAGQSNKVEAPVELKGEFLKAVMDEDYEKAKELCQKILLLEPDNKTCSEFHAVIVEKMKQEEENNDEDDDDDDDDDDEDSDESEESDEGDNEEEESDDESSEEEEEDESDSDDDFSLPPGPINLIMGGLPIRPQSS